MIDYKDLKTEKSNPDSKNLDVMSLSDTLSLFYNQDLLVLEAVKKAHPEIKKAIEIVSRALQLDGRVFYIGAGTSGRLGVLDASEIRPTFGVTKKIFVGIIAGGARALTNSIEGAEDDALASVAELKRHGFANNKNDVVLGITASGMTPYVLGALNYAKESGCHAMLLTCNMNVAKEYEGSFDVIIGLGVGSEIISGSTRLKSGTATKMALNMISSISMIKLGKVYQNYMVDLTPSCKKLINRACRIISDICAISQEEARELYETSSRNLKAAIIINKKGVDLKKAKLLLKKSGGFLRKALEDKEC